MLNAVVSGLLFGSLAIFIDAYLFNKWLGVEVPVISIAAVAFAVIALVGLKTSNDKTSVILTAIGVPLGLIGTNYLRQQLFDVESVLAPFGF